MSALAVFYGAPEPGHLVTLATHRTLILQTGLYAPAQLRWLRRTAHVLGYLSLGEDHALGDWPCTPGSAPYHGQSNPLWGSVRVDAAHPGWRATVMTRAARALAQADGLLLDTLDSADPAATTSLVRDLRAAWPHAALYANRGFALLAELAPVIDGVLIEAFSTTHTPTYAPHAPGGVAYTAHWLREVRALGLDALALDYADSPGLAALARARAARARVPTFVTDRALSLPGGYCAPPGPPAIATSLGAAARVLVT